MKKPFRVVFWAAVAALLVFVAAVAALYRASQHVPEFYRQAVAVDSSLQQAAGHKMEQRAAQLASNVQKQGRWHEVFTAEQINGWLAVRLTPWMEHRLGKASAEAMRARIRDPRVAITPDQVTLAFTCKSGLVQSVVSLSIDVRLAEPNVIVLRIRKARAGNVPLPLGQFLEQISEACRQVGWRIQWRENQGDPEARVTMLLPEVEDGREPRVEELRLEQDEVCVAGSTSRGR